MKLPELNVNEIESNEEFIKNHIHPMEVLLKFPFPYVDVTKLLRAACQDLKDFSWEGREESNRDQAIPSAMNGTISISMQDYKRLLPQKSPRDMWLNDTLIDMFMQWMLLDVKRAASTTYVKTHFYTKLTQSIDEASRWMREKNINVFEKKFVLIPINWTEEHWSLCVLVNADESNKVNGRGGGLLYFDSLSSDNTRRMQVHTNILAWLNSELKRHKTKKQPLTKETWPLCIPEGKF